MKVSYQLSISSCTTLEIKALQKTSAYIVNASNRATALCCRVHSSPIHGDNYHPTDETNKHSRERVIATVHLISETHLAVTVST